MFTQALSIHLASGSLIKGKQVWLGDAAEQKVSPRKQNAIRNQVTHVRECRYRECP
jgi:hypothetical protein